MSSVFTGINSESGNGDGVRKNARFSQSYGIAIDQQTGLLFISDYENHNIIKITPQGKSLSFFLSSCVVI
jgi:hypothetical protein